MESFLNDISGRYAPMKKLILNLCVNDGYFTLSELSREIGASIPKTSRIIAEMIKEGYVIEMGKLDSASGRHPSIYGLNPGAGYFVGIEVNADTLNLAVTDFKGRIVDYTDRYPCRLEGTEESVLLLCAAVRKYLDGLGIDQTRIRAYGVNLTGRVNHNTGFSYSYFISESRPIRDVLQEGFGGPVFVENDSRGMAYGEYVCGVARDEGTILFLNVGWGLRMGIILDGQLFYGKSGFSGEVGHFPLLDNNRICHCGKKGCTETGASGRALHRIFTEKLKDGQTSCLSEKFRTTGNVSLEDILEAIREEDVTAIESVEEVGATLGRAIAGLINIFNPDLVIIGGRLSAAEKYLMPPLNSTVNKLTLTLVNNDTTIKVSKLGKQAGAVGASLLSKIRLLNQQA